MSNIEKSAALTALLNYGQADEDGVMCITSRQAVHEVADELTRLRAEKAELVEALRHAVNSECLSEARDLLARVHAEPHDKGGAS